MRSSICIAGKGDDFIKKAFSSIIIFVVGMAIAFLIILSIFAKPLSSLILESPDNYFFIILAGFVILESVLLSICKLWYRMKENAKIYSAINIIQSFSAAGLAAAIAFSQGSIFELILVIALSESLITVVLLIHIGKRWGFSRPVFPHFPDY